MRQIFIQDHPQPGQVTLVTGDDHHHLTRSLRAHIGETWLLVDDTGGRFEGVIESITKSEARLKVVRDLGPEPELAPLTVAICLPKSDAFDACLEAATQLRVTQVAPLQSARSQDISANRRSRWQRIIRMSCCQCLRSKPMQILELGSLEAFLTAPRPGRKFLAWQGGEALKGVLEANEPLTFLIGPEGGFEEKEIAFAKAASWEPLALGPQILRVPVALSAGLGWLHAMRR